MSDPKSHYKVQRSPEARAVREKIDANLARYKAEGKKYPRRTVDYIDPATTIWCGMIPYDRETLETLNLSYEGRSLPAPLPDDFVIDGDGPLPDEPKRHYRLYCAYRDLGASRSYDAAAAIVPAGSRTTSIEQIASRWHWRERLAIWEAKLSAETQVAVQKAIAPVVDEYAENRATYLRREANIVDLTLTRLEEMLSLPARDKRVELEDGKTIIHWHAANWTYGDIAKLIAEMKTMARLNHGLPTSNTSLKIDQSVSGTISVNHTASALADAGSMTPAQRAAHEYAARKSETAYFDALAEYEATQGGTVVEGHLVAADG